MKKSIFLAVFGASLALCLSPVGASAQTEQVLALATPAADLAPLVTTEPTAGITNPGTGITRLKANEVSTKAVKSLKNIYKDAGEASWSGLNRSFLAEFKVGERMSRALFTKGGYMIYGITYGGEQDLPKEERRALKSNYIDYNIIHVAEVRTSDKVYWITTLEDKDHIVITRSYDGGFEELKAMVKYFQPKGKKVKATTPIQPL